MTENIFEQLKVQPKPLTVCKCTKLLHSANFHLSERLTYIYTKQLLLNLIRRWVLTSQKTLPLHRQNGFSLVHVVQCFTLYFWPFLSAPSAGRL